MQDIQRDFTKNFSSFELEDNAGGKGMHDWAVPWADLMMVMFVLFVVLFVYASTHQDVRILFSNQAAAEAQSTSTLDPLIGLIGQIASKADNLGGQDIVQVPSNEVLYRSRVNGISVVREANGHVRITLRGALFFEAKSGQLKPESGKYLDEIAKVLKRSMGAVHVIGYADQSEFEGARSFTLSSERANHVAEYLMSRFDIAPKRLVITGRGAYQPELPETSEKNQTLNRRVEILIANES